MKISWVVLTHNRAATTKKSLEWNLSKSGRYPEEFIWVDNGSDAETRIAVAEICPPDVSVLHGENTGVARGHNSGLVHATGSHIVMTGPDSLMPEGWLATFCHYFEQIPDTGVACMYNVPIEGCPERKQGDLQEIKGLPLIPAMPMGYIMFSRHVLRRAGYFREDFGLYGNDDLEWAHRVERVCREDGLRHYVIPGKIVNHLGDHEDPPEYRAFKNREANEPYKKDLLARCHNEGHKYYTPFL